MLGPSLGFILMPVISLQVSGVNLRPAPGSKTAEPLLHRCAVHGLHDLNAAPCGHAVGAAQAVAETAQLRGQQRGRGGKELET